jgi:flagellar FliL protein
MADEAKPADGKPEAGGGKKKLVPILAVVVLLLGGGGAWFFLGRSDEKADAKHEKSEEGGEEAAAEEGAASEHASATEEGEGEGEAAEGGAKEGGEAAGGKHAPLSERLITLDPFVVNLDENGAKRFLKTRIELETESPAEKAELQTRSAQMRDTIIVLLTSKRLEDLGGFEGKVILKNEIARRLNDTLGGDPIKSVLITEFVIQ